MKTPQNVHKMSTASPDTSREMAATINEWSSYLYSTNSLCFSSARRR